jgi:hypothetical protein
MANESVKSIRVLEEEKARLRKLHPTPEDIPTCLTVLEDFLSCNSINLLSLLNLINSMTRFLTVIGSQFRSLYREGQVATCRPKLDEFKFCLSLRSLSSEERREVWINRRADWWARRRISGSSEDVWEIRR